MGASNLQQVINYSSPGNFSFNSSLIDVSAGAARLKLGTGSLPKNQPFTSSTGFTFDSALAEFVGGQLQQKNQRLPDATFGAKWDSVIDGNWGNGSLVATALNGASIGGGKLDLTGGVGKALTLPAVNNTSTLGHKGCIRITFTPNYNGSPADAQIFWSLANSEGSNLNALEIMHHPNGSLFLFGNDKDGNNIFSNSLAPFVAVAGESHELEVDFDLELGYFRVFGDGFLFADISIIANRDSSGVDWLQIGNPANPGSDMYLSNFAVFSEPQHSANYTPGQVLPDADYLDTTVVCPAFVHSLLGTYLSYTNFVATETSLPRYTVKSGGGSFKYWSGSAWLVSDGSYAQANSAATLAAQLSNLADANGATSVTIGIHFQTSNTQSAVSDFVLTILSQTLYPTSSPSIIVNAGFLSDLLESLAQTTATVPSATGIKYTVNVNGQDKYWTGTAWANSDLSYAQANTAAEVNTNAEALNITSGATIKMRALLHSDDGLATPELATLTVGYSFYNEQSDPPTCTVWGFYRDISGNPVAGATVAFSLKRDPGQYQAASGAIIEAPQQTVTDVNGRFEIDLVQSGVYTVGGTYLVNISKDGNPKLLTNIISSKKPIEFQVPDATNVNITDLISAA